MAAADEIEMSWRNPNPFEKDLLTDTTERWPEIIPLAQCLVLAPRIEPRLLRNVRRHFVPQAQAEVESLLWFSPLVAARSTREIILHQGVAKVLADDWLATHAQPNTSAAVSFDPLWQFTRELTRHWQSEEQLERDLRYFALIGDEFQLQQGLQDILRHIRMENDDKRVLLSRLAKRTLPIVFPDGADLSPASEEAKLLAQYASLALGDAGAWAKLGQPQRLPEWLSEHLPPTIGTAELGVELRYDAKHGQVLHLIEAETASLRIPFPSPLPALLYVAQEEEGGSWYTVAVNSRIRITPQSSTVHLTTRDGRQWQLHTDTPLSDESVVLNESLRLSYVEADAQQAQAIAGWLIRQGIEVELILESGAPPDTMNSPGATRVIRLWTRAAQAFWARRQDPEVQTMDTSLLLRTETVEVPIGGGGPGQILDLDDWAKLDDSPEGQRLLENLRRWQAGGEIESAQKTPSPTPPEAENLTSPTEENQPGLKTCFVIQGCGKKTDFTDGRVLDLDASYEVIKEAVESAGLACVRADEIIHSGTIDVSMYERLLNADLVIADLSSNNVNTAYLLGVRYALRPYVTIVLAEEQFKSPFDLGHIVIRRYQHLGGEIGLREAKRLMAELKAAIIASMADPVIDSPVYKFLPSLQPPMWGSSDDSEALAKTDSVNHRDSLG